MTDFFLPDYLGNQQADSPSESWLLQQLDALAERLGEPREIPFRDLQAGTDTSTPVVQ